MHEVKPADLTLSHILHAQDRAKYAHVLYGIMGAIMCILVGLIVGNKWVMAWGLVGYVLHYTMAVLQRMYTQAMLGLRPYNANLRKGHKIIDIGCMVWTVLAATWLLALIMR